MKYKTFIEHASALAKRIEERAASGSQSIPITSLRWAADRIRELQTMAEADHLPEPGRRYKEMSRTVIDEWPLNDELSRLIVELENEYVRL